MLEPGYEKLAAVLQRAYDQAAKGKGKERHAAGEPFHEQVMQIGARKFGVGSLLFQAFKKSEESQRLPLDRGVNELLGAIVYLAGAVIAREAEGEQVMEVTGTAEPQKCCGQPHDCSDAGCAKRADVMAGWEPVRPGIRQDLGQRLVQLRGGASLGKFTAQGSADEINWSGATHYRLLP